MSKKIVWIIVTCLMTLSLVMASCGPAAEEEEEVTPEEEEVTTQPEEEQATVEEEQTVEEVSSNVPKYGGVLRIPQGSDPTYFEQATTRAIIGMTTMYITNEEPLTMDWARGPAGTGEYDYLYWQLDVWDTYTGQLAESWELPERGTFIFHIRPGVHWALNPDSEASRLVNGRELTADDVAFSLERCAHDRRAYLYNLGPALQQSVITATDKYTVEINVFPEAVEETFMRFANMVYIVPREVVETYGDMKDWRNSVGTGAFMLTDYVPSSSATMTRNPNYWDTDPVGPGKGMQLPYLDAVKYLIIPDSSTMMAAFRTAAIDVRGGVSWEDAALLQKEEPQLLYKELPANGGSINMRIDKPELPFHDIRVRRALMMATDFDSINNDLYEGKAEINTWPIVDLKEYHDAYLSIDDPDCPESVKELYVYNPSKARELLTEAGYPNGFTTKIYISNSQVDYSSIIKDMWAKVGITLELDIVEASVQLSTVWARKYDEMCYGTYGGVGTLFRAGNYWGTGAGNSSYVNDPVVDQTRAEMQLACSYGKQEEAMGIHRELMKYVLDQAWAIPRPFRGSYNFWWPWIKNYHGEVSLNYSANWNMVRYMWIDQGLKKSMGH